MNNKYRALNARKKWEYGYFAVIPKLPLPQQGGGEELREIDSNNIVYENYIIPSDYKEYQNVTTIKDLPLKKVEKETECRFVGSIGKNKIDVYEKDFIIGTINPFDKFNGKIIFDEELKAFVVKFYKKPDRSDGLAIFQGFKRELSYFQNANLEIVGNVFDNPELETQV